MELIGTANKAKKRNTVIIGLGGASLLTVMVVLMLTSFALLSLLSANSDLLLSEKAAKSVEDYYTADCQAETWWHDLNNAIENSDGRPIDDKLVQAGFQFEFYNGVYIVGDNFPMREKKKLIVSASVSESGQVKILQWQSMPVYTEK
jgi:hypothetical protein